MNKGFINKFWSLEDIEILKFLYPNRTNAFIADLLGKKEAAIIGKAFKLRLIKDKQFILECSKKSQFKPGQISHNKGKKQADYMAPEAIERTKASRFTKGHLPHNAKQADGELSQRGGYWYIRISLADWRVFHHLQYEKFIGEIPEGHVVIFKDNDANNTHPFNLQMVSYRENMFRNTIQRYPKELISTIKALSKLKKQIKNYGKEQVG